MVSLENKEVLREIFEYLNGMQLAQAAQVCRYPSKNVIVWGGVLHDISICSTFDSVSNCKETINFISLLLSGRNMESWYMVLGPYHKKASRISYKFKTFTQSVHLRKHSVAFMFTSDTRGEKFYYLEIGLFEKHFPTVPLFKICGITALAGENIKG
ncbi:hypothetical protein M0802_005910 [Mischocyttarus mexicanus]|nr:hypothetical protein M0802_005910 [Mischocyttarus mexicanus]